MKKIISIEATEEQDLIDIETESHTFIAEDMICHNSALEPALMQFREDALIIIPSSPYNETGMAYELYRNSIKMDQAGNPEFPTMLTIQLSSWDPYEDWDNVEACDGMPFNRRQVPQLYDNAMKALEQREPEKFRVENLSQWAKVTDAFLNPRIVERIFVPFKDSTGIERILTPQDQGKLGYIYYGHADPSKNNNNFAVMVAHSEEIYDAENNETWTHVIVDYINCYKPEDFPEHQIDYAQIEDDLIDVLDRFRSIRKFTFDQYGSFVTVDSLKKRLRSMRPAHRAMILEEKASLQSNMQRAERFKSAIGMNWVHSFKDQFGPEETCLLEQELKFLQLKNGKVQKMSYGPIRTEDIADCHDDQTEILTENGWKLFKDVLDNEQVATVDSEGRLEYQLPIARIDKPYKGKLVTGVELPLTRVNFAVTPNHRMIERRLNNNRENFFIKAKDLTPSTSGVRKQLPLAPWGQKFTESDELFSLKGIPDTRTLKRVKDIPSLLPDVELDDFAAFLGFWIAEGSKGRRGYEVRVTQKKEETRQWFENLLQKMNWSYSTRIGRFGETDYSIKSLELTEYLLKLGSKENLHLPDEVFNWPSSAQEALVHGYWLGDGNSGIAAPRAKFRDRTAWSISKRLLDDFQRLLIHLGRTSVIKENRPKGSSVTIKGKEFITKHTVWQIRQESWNFVITKDNTFGEQDYDGQVYCFTVPNGTLITRRNGRTLVAGNCIQHCVDNLLEDNFHKLELRDRLGKTTLGVAAMGGYHSHTPSELAGVGKVSGRQKLKSFSNTWRSYNNQGHDPARGRRGYKGF